MYVLQPRGQRVRVRTVACSSVANRSTYDRPSGYATFHDGNSLQIDAAFLQRGKRSFLRFL